MDFLTACQKCKPGYYFKASGWGWSEYSVQYGRNYKGELYWTAGHTAGGPLTKDMEEAALKLKGDYGIYSAFGDRMEIHPDRQQERIDPAIIQAELRNDFVNELWAIPIAYGQLGGEVAEKASRCTIESVLELLDKGHGDTRYRLQAKRKNQAPVVISGDLLKLFDEINT